MKSISIKSLVVVLLLLLVIDKATYSQIDFPIQSAYRFLKGIEAVSLSTNWVNPDFDDSGWSKGNAPFRYGKGTGGTDLTDMRGNYSTVFMRSKFSVVQANLIKEVKFTADWDDGFVLFINGKEVISRNAPSEIRYDALSNGLHDYGAIETIKIPTTEFNLVEGENTLAVFGCNVSLAGSSDFYFDISISASIPIPSIPELVDTVGITFDKPSGFYDANMTLTMTTPVPDVVIVYTLDGSNPQTSLTRMVGSTTTQVAINPSSALNRGRTPAVVVRASIYKDGFMASKPELRTYIYLEHVKTQSQPGWDWPTTNVNGQEIDLEMDPEVVDNPEYGDYLTTSFLDIPTISLVTDNSSLFSADSGIYVNAMQQGEEWERQCAVELINPDGSEGFNLNAGVRIRGGWSRHNNYPKHAFRLFFRKEYGDSVLNFPLFENEGVNHFDKIDLRCEQNYSWSNDAGQYNTFVREVFTRDLQGEMGEPYTRSRYYHLYLNGMYWGLFQTQERCAASFASDYLGGKKDDWDVIKIGGVSDYDLYATDGNLDKWRKVWDITSNGYADNANYFLLQGKNSEGKLVKNSEILVDIDNLIDYMINIFYTGNYDSPVSAFGQNKMPNNMYAIKNHNDKGQGFKFLVHDAEHTMMFRNTNWPGIGLQENRVNIGYLSDGNQMTVGSFERFHIQWLHHKLVENMEYRQRFADRAYNYLNGKGVLTVNANIDRFDNRASQVNMAVIAESARWGDTKSGSAYTKADWKTELNSIRDSYFPYRGDILKSQLLEYELYPSVSAPIIKMNGAEIVAEKVFLTAAATVTFSTSAGEIYYTLSGEDPRLIGGGLSPKAIKIATGGTLSIPESAIVKARCFTYGNWSAIRTVNFIAEQAKYTNFKVTELHYHPLDSIIAPGDTIQDDNFEFIEFKNTGYTSAINLSGLEFVSAIEYKFPDNFLLAPQQYIVIAAKPAKFYDRCGMVATGNFAGNFTNSGEEIIIINSKGAVVMEFTFNDTDPWPVEPDGLGYSLVSKMANPDDDPNDYSYWRKSNDINGSPFYDDDSSSGVEDELTGNLAEAYMIYPNPTNNELTVGYKGNRELDFAIELYDLKGKLLFTQTYNQIAKMYLSEIKIDYGVYFLKIKTGDGNVTQKVVYAPR